MSKISISKNKDKNLLFLPDAEFMQLAEQYITAFYPHRKNNNPKTSSLPIPAIASTKHVIISAIAAPNKIKLKERITSDINKLHQSKYLANSLIYLSFARSTFTKKDLALINKFTKQYGYTVSVINLETIYNKLLSSNIIPVTTDKYDLANYYNSLFSTPKSLPNVLDEIFDYVNEINPSITLDKPFKSSLIHLRDKIDLNFISHFHRDILNDFNIHWNDKILVEQFLHANFELYEKQFYKVLNTIKTAFIKNVLNIKKSANAKVVDPTVFNDLSEHLIKPENRSDPRHQGVALVLVFLFFEYCDFGDKSPKDPQTLFTEHENDYTK